MVRKIAWRLCRIHQSSPLPNTFSTSSARTIGLLPDARMAEPDCQFMNPRSAFVKMRNLVFFLGETSCTFPDWAVKRKTVTGSADSMAFRTAKRSGMDNGCLRIFNQHTCRGPDEKRCQPGSCRGINKVDDGTVPLAFYHRFYTIHNFVYTIIQS